jgi:hypothetical protein
MNNKNFFIASLHLLTNINSLLYLVKINEADIYNNIYIPLWSGIFKDNKNFEDNENIKGEIIALNNRVFNALNYDKNDDEPKKLIIKLLEDMQKYKLLPDTIIYNFEYKCEKCNNIKGNNKLKFIEFNIPEIIENTINPINKISTISIDDCLKYYFDSLNKNNSSLFCEKCKGKKFEVIIKKLPKDLIIFIDYGKELKDYDLSLKFNEEINFKNFDILNEEDKNREYFLSSLIVSKNMGSYLEIYYTYARKDEESLYNIYNGSDVRDNMKVTNKLNKEKICLKNYKESWPVVLVFTDKKQEEEQ